MIRNEGTNINIKTVRRIIKSNNLQLPYAKHKNRTNKRNLTKLSDIHYVSTYKVMYYLMSVKDYIKPIEEAYTIRYK